MPVISANDPRLIWSGTLSLKEGLGWVKPWRIPHGDVDLYSPGESGLAGRAEMPSGVRVRLATDAEELVVGCEPLAEDGRFDLCIGGEIAATASYPAGATEVRFEGLPTGEKSVEIWLSPAMPVAVRHIALPEGSALRKKRRYSAEVGCVRQFHHSLPHRGIACHHLARGGSSRPGL